MRPFPPGKDLAFLIGQEIGARLRAEDDGAADHSGSFCRSACRARMSENTEADETALAGSDLMAS